MPSISAQARIRYHVERMTWVWLVYAAGVIAGLVMADGRPFTRLALALLWPLGPAALLVVVVILVLASLVAFPLVGALVVLAAAAAWMVF